MAAAMDQMTRGNPQAEALGGAGDGACPGVSPAAALVLPLGMGLGGVETWAVALGRALKRRGGRAVLLEYPVEPDQPKSPPPEDLPLVPLQAHGWRIPGSNLNAFALQLPAVFIPNGSIRAFATCARLSRLNGPQMRVIGMCHTDDGHYYRVLSHYEPLIHRFVAVSSQVAERLRAALPAARREDVVVRPYGVPVPRTLRREYSSAPQTPLRLVYAGRLEQRQKRVSNLIVLARRLEQRGVNFQLTVLGDGPERATLATMLEASTAQVQQRVRLAGAVAPEEVLRQLAAHDACVLVSAFEGTSIVMLEAMAQGCVPVVTKVSGTDVIRDGVNGCCVPVGDMEAMAQRIAWLAEDRARVQALGRQAHETAQPFSGERYADWFAELLEEVWRQAPRCWPPLRRKTIRVVPLSLARLARRSLRRLRELRARVSGRQ